MDVTVENLLLSVLSMLVGFVIWTGRRYIAKDDDWKAMTDAKIDTLMILRSTCIRDFASSKDLDEAFSLLRDHGERLASLESKITICKEQGC